MHIILAYLSAAKAATVRCELPVDQWGGKDSWCDAQGAWVTEKLLRPRPVTADLFAERIAGVDAAAGAAIVKALSGAGLLNATGFLLEDPRSHPLTSQPQKLAAQ